MNSITVDDLQGEAGAGLLKHLQGDDFFSVEKNPEAMLTITSVIPQAAADTYEVNATLTIKGITKPISFIATLDPTGTTANAPISIDRTAWDIKFRSLKFFSDVADKAIEDTIMFDVTLQLQ